MVTQHLSANWMHVQVLDSGSGHVRRWCCDGLGRVQYCRQAHESTVRV